jgi:PAS domain S-box-containing protein
MRALGDALRPLADPSAIQATACRMLGDQLNASRATCFVIEGGQYVVQQDYSRDLPALAGPYPLGILGTRILQALRAGEDAVVVSVASDSLLAADEKASYASVQVDAFIAVPLVKDGGFVAALSVQSGTPRDWTTSEIALVREAAERIWDAVERARAVEALQISDARLRALFSQMVGGVAETDLSGRFLAVNRRYCEMVGYSAEELLQIHIQDISHPDDYERNHQQVQQLFHDGQPFDIEKRYVRRDGAIIWVHNHVSVVADAAGRACGIISVSVDITERKQQEQQLRRGADLLNFIIDRSPFGFYIVDADFRISHMNADSQARAFRHVNPAIGQRLDEAIRVLWPEDVAAVIIDRFRQTLETGEPYVAPALVSQRADLPVVESYEWQLQRITMPDGRHAVVCYYYDTTRLSEAERALRESVLRKDAFLATLAHELRNPLAPLRNGVHLLRHVHTSGGASSQGVLQMMDRQLIHLVRLVDDLLDVSRITRGKLELRRKPMDFASVVEGAVEISRPAIDAGRHRLLIQQADGPLLMHADADRLIQVLSNLLNNAARYTDSGGEIQLTTARDGINALVSVRDNGMGIAAEMLGTIFEPFTQLDRSGERVQGGLGIGLTLARSIVEMHGGSLEARSEGPGRGSEFLVRLPMIAAPAV